MEPNQAMLNQDEVNVEIGTGGARLSAVLGPMPVPHEHGAWAMLYVPLFLVLGALWPVPFLPLQILPSLLLLLTVTGAFLAQHAATQVLRARGGRGMRLWLGIFLGLMGAGGLPLLFRYERVQLLVIGALGLAFFAAHAYLSQLPSGKKRVRSERWEMLSLGVMALTAPAAYITVRGGLDGGGSGSSGAGPAWPELGWMGLSWLVCTLYFVSSILYVKMLLAGARLRGQVDSPDWRQAQKPVLAYHLGLLGLVGMALSGSFGTGGLWLGAAFVPALVRAWVGATRPVPTVPKLKRVGVAEVVYSLWFMGCAAVGLRRLLGGL